MKQRLYPVLWWAGLCGVASLAGGCAKSEPAPPPAAEVRAPKPPPASTEEFWTSEQLVYLQEKFGALETTPEGLRYKILQPGTGEERPGRANLATVHYRGTFLDDQVFGDSRRMGRPFQFRVGVGGVIKGWDLAVADMRKGEKRLVVVPYWLGYGASGRNPTIPPRATLVFEIELLDWESTAKVPGAPAS